MDFTNKDFLAGVVAGHTLEMEVDEVASGGYDTVPYSWYRIFDPNTGACAVVMANTSDMDVVAERIDSWMVEQSDSFNRAEKRDFTQRLLATCNLSDICGRDDGPETWVVMLEEEGWVSPKWVDADLLRATLAKGAASLGTEFDFEALAKRSGFKTKRKAGKKKGKR